MLMVTINFSGSTTALLDNLSFYWNSYKEYFFPATLINNSVSHNFDSDDKDISFIVIPQDNNTRITSIKFVDNRIFKNVSNYQIKLDINSNVKVFKIQMLNENEMYNTIGISKYYLVFPQFMDGYYLQALSNFVFFDMHRRQKESGSVKIQTERALKFLNGFYNTQFFNAMISYLYKQ